jgi:hypothetical protein
MEEASAAGENPIEEVVAERVWGAGRGFALVGVELEILWDAADE